jgi:hypothetical protein
VAHIPISGRGNDETDKDDLIRRVQSADLEVKKEVLEAALRTAADHNSGADLIRYVISTAPNAEIRKAAVGKAVETADPRHEQEILSKAFREAHPAALEKVVDEHGPSQRTLDKVWQWIVVAFASVLGVATIGIFVVIGWDTVVEPDTASVDPAHLQIMLTVFTTTAGILAGFITGHAVGKATEGNSGKS